jgi:hypothetical protein
MGVRDEIFPTKPRRRDHVQTQWASGWAYAVIGFGEAARMLTEQREKMQASVDQIGLAVFYLQRHRVELVIKQALTDLGVPYDEVTGPRHNLAKLWRRLGVAVEEKTSADHWRELSEEHGGFIAVVHEADQSSLTYRYPVDLAGTENRRADFIDLHALEHYAARFENGLQGYTDMVDAIQREAPDDAPY